MILDPFKLTDFKRLLSLQLAPYSAVYYFEKLDSTNQYLLDHKTLGAGAICIAQEQGQGRGQFGRPWISESKENLYVSILWEYQKPMELTLLPQYLALAVVSALGEYGFPVNLKWPNDIFMQGKKLAGLLIESVYADKVYVVAGLGLNICMGTGGVDKISQPWVDLQSCSSATIQNLTRSELGSKVVSAMLFALKSFSSDSKGFINTWNQHDLFYGKTVVWEKNGIQFQGLGKGLALNGGYSVFVDKQIKVITHSKLKLRLR